MHPTVQGQVVVKLQGDQPSKIQTLASILHVGVDVHNESIDIATATPGAMAGSATSPRSAADEYTDQGQDYDEERYREGNGHISIFWIKPFRRVNRCPTNSSTSTDPSKSRTI